MKSQIKLFAGMTLLALVIIFTLQNSDVITIRFLFWSVALSRALVLFLVFSAGVVIGWLLSGIGRLREKGRQKEPGREE